MNAPLKLPKTRAQRQAELPRGEYLCSNQMCRQSARPGTNYCSRRCESVEDARAEEYDDEPLSAEAQEEFRARMRRTEKDVMRARKP